MNFMYGSRSLSISLRRWYFCTYPCAFSVKQYCITTSSKSCISPVTVSGEFLKMKTQKILFLSPIADRFFR